MSEVARDATAKTTNYERSLFMNVLKLKGKMVEKEVGAEALAAYIGIDKSSIYRKLNNAEKITIGEAAKIKEALKLTDEEAYEIFLA